MDYFEKTEKRVKTLKIICTVLGVISLLLLVYSASGIYFPGTPLTDFAMDNLLVEFIALGALLLVICVLAIVCAVLSKTIKPYDERTLSRASESKLKKMIDVAAKRGLGDNESDAWEWLIKRYPSADNVYNCACRFIDGYFYNEGAFNVLDTHEDILDSRGLVLYGKCFYSGEGTKVDRNKAYEAYRKAYLLGNPDSLRPLVNLAKDKYEQNLYCLISKFFKVGNCKPMGISYSDSSVRSAILEFEREVNTFELKNPGEKDLYYIVKAYEVARYVPATKALMTVLPNVDTPFVFDEKSIARIKETIADRDDEIAKDLAKNSTDEEKRLKYSLMLGQKGDIELYSAAADIYDSRKDYAKAGGIYLAIYETNGNKEAEEKFLNYIYTGKLNHPKYNTIEVYEKGAKLGYYHSILICADYYYRNKNYSKALSFYKRCDGRLNKAQNSKCAYMYYYGHGCDIDYDSAYSYCRKAIDQGGTGLSFLIIALCYLNGVGVAKDLTSALYYANRAKEMGTDVDKTIKLIKDTIEVEREYNHHFYRVDYAYDLKFETYFDDYGYIDFVNYKGKVKILYKNLKGDRTHERVYTVRGSGDTKEECIQSAVDNAHKDAPNDYFDD